MAILYHHRGPIEPLLIMDRWWRRGRIEDPLFIRLDEDDDNLYDVISHYEGGAFLPHWDVYYGPRLDDAIDLSSELRYVFGIEAARELFLVSSDHNQIGLQLLIRLNKGPNEIRYRDDDDDESSGEEGTEEEDED